MIWIKLFSCFSPSLPMAHSRLHLSQMMAWLISGQEIVWETVFPWWRFSSCLYSSFKILRLEEKERWLQAVSVGHHLAGNLVRRSSWVGQSSSRWCLEERWCPKYSEPRKLLLLKFELEICFHVIAYRHINYEWPPKPINLLLSYYNLSITKWPAWISRENQYLLGGYVSLLRLP